MKKPLIFHFPRFLALCRDDPEKVIFFQKISRVVAILYVFVLLLSFYYSLNRCMYQSISFDVLVLTMYTLLLIPLWGLGVINDEISTGLRYWKIEKRQAEFFEKIKRFESGMDS